MTTAFKSTATALAFAAMFTALAAAQSGVRDGAKLFSEPAVAKATAEFDGVKKATGLDTLIETFPAMPTDKAEKFATLSDSDKASFVRAWAKERAIDAKIDGIYILICKSPAKYHVFVSNDAGKRLGRDADESLVGRVGEQLKAKKFDALLADIPPFMTKRAAAHATPAARTAERKPAGAPAVAPVAEQERAPAHDRGVANDRPVGRPDNGMSGYIWIAVLIVGALILFSIVKSLARGMAGGPAYAGGGGGGGFMGSLFAGMGGEFLGNYLYNSMFSGHDVHAGDHGAGMTGDGDTGYSGGDGGGDWGGGGSDLGGGGDWGGGGDFGGGGGGDW